MTIDASGQLREANRALFRRMALSHFDFEETLRFLDRLQPIRDDVKPVQDDAVQVALMTALLVSYWRPFSTSEDDGQTAKRLPSELLKGLSRVSQGLQSSCRLHGLRNGSRQEGAHRQHARAEVDVVNAVGLFLL